MIREIDLKQYLHYKAALRICEEEIEQAYRPISSPQAKEVVGGKLSATVPSNPTEQALNEISRLKERAHQYREIIAAVDGFIDSIADEYIWAICHLHYRKGFSWEKTAAKIYKVPNQRDTVRKAAKRYLEDKITMEVR